VISLQNTGGTGAGLWLRWVLANALGEALGLEGTALIWALSVLNTGKGTGIYAILVLAAFSVLAGTLIEGTVVGTAQWLVLRRPLPHLRWRTWVLATGAGAFLAWTLGMVPSTLLSLGSGGGTPPAEPGEATVLGLAFLMGLALGPVLGVAQWVALRPFVRRAALWVLANALAWACGMVVIFAGIDLAMGGGLSPAVVPILALTLACAGALVGAVHGLALVWLLRPARRLKANPESEER
jgi:hypothetical protein